MKVGLSAESAFDVDAGDVGEADVDGDGRPGRSGIDFSVCGLVRKSSSSSYSNNDDSGDAGRCCEGTCNGRAKPRCGGNAPRIAVRCRFRCGNSKKVSARGTGMTGSSSSSPWKYESSSSDSIMRLPNRRPGISLLMRKGKKIVHVNIQNCDGSRTKFDSRLLFL